MKTYNSLHNTIPGDRDVIDLPGAWGGEYPRSVTWQHLIPPLLCRQYTSKNTHSLNRTHSQRLVQTFFID